MITAFKEFHFSAAHSLCIPGHRCSTVHGHNFKLRVEVTGPRDGNGMVIDFARIKEVVEPLIKKLDHGNLNDHMPSPTSENLAEWFADYISGEIPGLSRIEIRETDTCGAFIQL